MGLYRQLDHQDGISVPGFEREPCGLRTWRWHDLLLKSHPQRRPHDQTWIELQAVLTRVAIRRVKVERLQRNAPTGCQQVAVRKRVCATRARSVLPQGWIEMFLPNSVSGARLAQRDV